MKAEPLEEDNGDNGGANNDNGGEGGGHQQHNGTKFNGRMEEEAVVIGTHFY